MNKTKLTVPPGITYISEWTDYKIWEHETHILDKKVPGCGFTEYALTCPWPVILCSPRKILLQNKKDKHGDTVYYFNNELEEELNTAEDLEEIGKKKYTGDLDRNMNDKIIKKLIRDSGKTLEEMEGVLEETPETPESIEYLRKSKEDLTKYIEYCKTNGINPKILVTYDSFKHVRSVLEWLSLFNSFVVVVDEFQSIFTDSRFKPDTELGFLGYLKDHDRVCFVSATPMMEEYLDKIDEFCDLPYIELDWESEEPGRLSFPTIQMLRTDSILSSAKKIIESYQSGAFESAWDPVRGEWVKSTEAVFFVNSVNNIINIIKRSKLSPGEVNILCAVTEENKERVTKRLGKEYTLGRVPLKGEPHKMFTFCTRTVYIGADFMSDNARTFILSDATLETMAVDISLDIPQILGRQRLECNPFRNKATLYYKLGNGGNWSEKIMNEYLKFKMDRTESILNVIRSTAGKDKKTLVEEMEILAGLAKYKYQYISVTRKVPVINKLVYLAEKRAFDIIGKDYLNKFTLLNRMRSIANTDKVTNFVMEVLKNKAMTVSERLKRLCNATEFTDTEKSYMAREGGDMFDNYYNGIGPDRCRALSFDIHKLKSEIRYGTEKRLIGEYLESRIVVGESYTLKDLKAMIGEILESINAKGKIPKAAMIKEYYSVKPTRITVESGQPREHGFKILEKL